VTARSDADAPTHDAPTPDLTENGPTPIGEVVRYCALVFVGLRVLMLVIGLVAVAAVQPIDPVGVPGWAAHPLPDPGWHNALTAWERFDALWFLRIADAGYGLDDGSAAFFPLFPLAIRGVSILIGGHPFGAAVLVSNAAFLGALVMTYRLTERELDARRARTTVVLMSFFPTSYFFLMPYSESLFLLFVVASFWGARTGRWALAGACGALAAMTRSIGLVLVPALAVEALHQRAEGRGPAWPGLLAAAGTTLGTVSYLVWWQVRAGDFLAPLTRQQNWQREFSWPWATLWRGTRSAFDYVGVANGGYWLADWLIVVAVLGLSGYAVVRYRPTYGVYLIGSLLVPLTYVFPDRPLMSMPRFVLPLFPAFWAGSELIERFRVPRWAVVAAGAAGIGLLSVLTVNWYYLF
jgi:hypothetical protein